MPRSPPWSTEGFRGLAKARAHWHAPTGDRRTKDQRTTPERAYNRCQAGLRALVEQSIGRLATAWSLRRWRGLLYRARDVFRAAAALISLGRWLHRLPALTGITETLNDVPGLAAHRARRRPEGGRSSVSGLALDGAASQIGSTVASGGCDAVHDHAGRQPGSDLRKEAALCLPRGADAGASTTGTTRRCSRSLGFPGPPRPRSAIRDRLSRLVMGR
jgi:hypothetical protein